MNANYYISTYMCFYASNPPSYPKQLCGKCNHFEKCFDFLFKKKNMETKEVKIEIPEGYEIDESKSSFEKIVFKKKENKLPESWNEYVLKYNPITNHKSYLDINSDKFKRVYIDLKYAKALLALSRLIILRDVYNDGWNPDWLSCDEDKFVIYYYRDEIETDCLMSTSTVLAFKTEELRDEFYNNFKDLIEQAKELL